MPTLIVENMPVEVYERLRQRAEAEQRSVPEETLHLLDQALRLDVKPSPRLPDFTPGQPLPAQVGPAAMSAAECRQGILDTAGKWQGEFQRPEQGPYEQREPLS